MTFTTLAVTYVVGGLTFVPLLLIVVLLSAWLLLPQVKNPGEVAGHRGVLGEEDEKNREASLLAQREKYDSGDTADGAASATFAVLRSHHFPSALAALNAKSSTGGGSAGGNGATDGTVEAGGNSESVYQSMYRSVFDRRKDANTVGSVLENAPVDGSTAAGNAARAKRKAVGASIFYIVLRHGHLMLYDSPAQLEVRHVISLAHHAISLSEGQTPDDNEEGPMMDADLFIKRTAIVLTPTHLPNGHQQSSAAHPKPFYLFSSTCSEKEDFYHALLSTRAQPPIPQPLSAEDMIKLQSTIHSTSLTPETRAFNALVGRIFLAIYRTSVAETFIRSKIEKKIARVQKPAFVASLAVKSIDLGDAAPVLSNPRLKDMNISGDMTLAFDLRYNGRFQVVIAAVAKLDLGTRFKPRTIDVVLATSLQRMQAHVLVRVKPPPSNRIWFCFESAPEMEIKVEPVVSSRQITYTFILRAIEERIRSVITETLVKPNWDDVPFFDTKAQKVRGGIWVDEGGETVETEKERVPGGGETADALASAASTVNGLAERNDKTMSMPALATTNVLETDTSAASSSSENAFAAAITSSALKDQLSSSLKRRSVASLPPQRSSTGLTASTTDSSQGQMAPPPKPHRSPSFTSPTPATPSVAVDGAYGLPVRSDDVTLQPKPASKWRSRTSQQGPQGRKPMEAVDAVREMRDRTALPIAQEDSPAESAATDAAAAASASAPVADTLSAETDELDLEPAGISDDEEDRGEDRAPWSGTPRSFDSDQASTASSKSGAQRRAEQRNNILAATAAATNAAKNWSWNAIANARTRQQQGNGRGRGRGADGSEARMPPSHPRNTAPPPAVSPSSSPAPPAAAHPEQQPMGRGKPLPPPGTPLPGPDRPLQKSLWSAAAAGLAAGSIVKRKPVLPPRRTASTRTVGAGQTGSEHGAVNETAGGQEKSMSGQANGSNVDADLDGPLHHGEEEFGPWNENSGIGAPVTTESADASEEDHESAEDVSAVVTPFDHGAEAAGLGMEGNGESASTTHDTQPAVKVPPPLPPRRRNHQATPAAQAQSPEEASGSEQEAAASPHAISAHDTTEPSRDSVAAAATPTGKVESESIGSGTGEGLAYTVRGHAHGLLDESRTIDEGAVDAGDDLARQPTVEHSEESAEYTGDEGRTQPSLGT